MSSLTACGGGGTAAKTDAIVSQPGISAPLPINSGGPGLVVPPPEFPVQEAAPPGADGVLLSGQITFDHVPFDSRRFKGLNYPGTVARPARGVTVQLLDDRRQVTATGQTDDQGYYQLTAWKNTDVQVRVLAELASRGTGFREIKVRDNTRANAHYALDGALVRIGDSPQHRDLHAASGWAGGGYTAPRSAAPFAILDSIYSGLQTVLQVAPDLVLTPLDVYWSPDNITLRGDLAKGEIGTSFFTSAGPAIYLLGAANNDSDEYDRAVVQHELAHYLEHELGRPESVGGSHNINSRLDLRVAFSEAWGNAFAGMVSGDPLYRDSLGSNQSSNYVIDVETTSLGQKGWFSEDTVQSIFYDLFDDAADRNDTISLGFQPIFSALFSDEFLDAPGVSSIYSFTEVLKQHNPAFAPAIDQLLTDSSIFGRGWLGNGEKNSGQTNHALPVFTALTPGTARDVCSDNSVQEYNGLAVRRLLAVSLLKSATYRFVARNSGGALAVSNPQMRLLQRGEQLVSSRSASANVETFSRSLTAGDYVLEVYEEGNVDRDTSTGGLACFTVTVN